jgi:fluoroquinolone transport system ATP-binding protein
MITVNDLSYRYPRAVVDAVRGISFSVAPGEVFGFLGPSGAGKSTTQKILMGSLAGYKGSAVVGRVEAGRADGSFRASIGVAFEFPCFYQKLTGMENLVLFSSMYSGQKDEPRALLDRLGLGEAADRRVGEYSKGMRMRLNLARALIHRPRMLFLDEPTSGLDPANARTVRELVLERAASGASVFLTTHDMAAADALCDRVAFLVDGRIAACDAPAALKRRHGRRAVVVEHETLDGNHGGMAGGTNGKTTGGDSAGVPAEFSLDGLADNPAFLAELRKPGLVGIRTLDASLDRIFLELTGKELA